MMLGFEVVLAYLGAMANEFLLLLVGEEAMNTDSISLVSVKWDHRQMSFILL